MHISKEQKRERRKRCKQAFKKWLAKNYKAVNFVGCFVFILICFIIVDIILFVNNPEFFQWYLELFLI